MNIKRKLAYYYAMLFAKPNLVGLHYLMLKIALKGIGILNFYNKSVSGEEYFISKILPRLITNSSPILFDVGANQGHYSLLLARHFPAAKIFAFEPHPGNYFKLSKLEIANLSTFNLALSDFIGSTGLYDHAGSSGTTNATLHKNVFDDLYNENADVHVVKVSTLNEITRALEIRKIDFLKVDTEGNELAILKGGEYLLRQEFIGSIQFEFNEMNVFSRTFFYDFRQLLNNYVLFRMLPRGLLPLSDTPLLTELFAYQNVLAIPKSRIFLLGKKINGIN